VSYQFRATEPLVAITWETGRSQGRSRRGDENKILDPTAYRTLVFQSANQSAH